MFRGLLMTCLSLLLAGCTEPGNHPQQKIGAGATFEIHTIVDAKTPKTKTAIDPQSGEQIFLLTPPVITTADVEAIGKPEPAEGEIDHGGVTFKLTANGGKKMSAATARTGGRLAIVVNGKVKSAPIISAQIFDTGQVSGDPDLFEQLIRNVDAVAEEAQ